MSEKRKLIVNAFEDIDGFHYGVNERNEHGGLNILYHTSRIVFVEGAREAVRDSVVWECDCIAKLLESLGAEVVRRDRLTAQEPRP